MVKYLVAVLLTLLFTIGIAMAEAPKTFDQMDSDGDGFISKSEAADRADIKQNWSQADTDRDNRLDAAEFSAFEGREMFQPAEVEEPEPGAAPTK